MKRLNNKYLDNNEMFLLAENWHDWCTDDDAADIYEHNDDNEEK